MRVTGVFSVGASAARDVDLDELDVGKDLDLDRVADLVWDRAERVSLCHECAHELDDPELEELVQLEVDGETYVLDKRGGWVRWEPPKEAGQ